MGDAAGACISFTELREESPAFIEHLLCASPSQTIILQAEYSSLHFTDKK